LESNWRRWVLDSGLTDYHKFDGFQYIFGWRFIAKLVVPYLTPYGLASAIALLEGPDYTKMYFMYLGEGEYPEVLSPTGDEFDAPFPGPWEVVPDRPEVAWG